MIFWVSNLYNFNTLKKNKYMSAAATEWQIQFINAIKNNSGLKVNLINFSYNKFWPLGDLTVNKNLFNLKGVKNLSFDYLNLPGIKNILIKKKIKENFYAFATKDKNIFFTYNFDKNIINTAQELKKKNVIKWVAIVADYDSINKQKIEEKLANADLVIYLSEYSFKKSSLKSKKLIQGGIDRFEISRIKKVKSFLYSGSLGPWIDIEKFINDFNKIKDKEIKFYITSNDKLYFDRHLKSENKNIIFLGFRSKKDLIKISKKTDIFINLRNELNTNNNNNFPSKILNYLKYCKPIISTDQLSYGKNLRDLLIIKKKNITYDQLIRKAITFDPNFLLKKKKQSKKFIKENYNWNKIIKNLLTTIND